MHDTPAVDDARHVADDALVGLAEAGAELGWSTASLPGAAEPLVTMRSSFTGWAPSGRRSAGGSARLLEAADGWVVVNLPRPDDLDLVPAWLPATVPAPVPGVGCRVPWDVIGAAISSSRSDEVVRQGQLLGLAVADVRRGREPDEQLVARGTVDPGRPFRRTRARRVDPARPPARPLVVDLSSLWAGPLCARLLTDLGADVVKVESSTRPDGARRGHAGFFATLHAGQRSVTMPLATAAGHEELVHLLADADVVIEGSRPRALEAMGIDPADVVAARPGVVWLSITAYGRTGPWSNRVGFGDDAAAAGGLVSWDGDGPSFVGDAIADPLTGIVGAMLVARALADGGGVVIDLSLREVARTAACGAVVVP